MSTRITTRMLVGLVGAAAVAVLAAPTAVAQDEVSGGQSPMCAGRSDPSMRLNAHANGTPKYVLNLETDPAGVPTGVLVLGRSADRVYVDDFCRFWHHLPGQEEGGHEDGGHEDGGHEVTVGEVTEGATTAHAVGFGTLRDGTRVLVRTDVRQTEEGAFFRARYRPMAAHGDHDESAVTDHEDEEWTAVPAEGWAPLDRLNLR